MAIIKKISELEQMEALSDVSNIIIEENGVAKRIAASEFSGGTGTVKSVNGVEPDADGNVEVTIESSIDGLERTENRVTAIDETADDEHYPTAKAVYDFVNTNVSDTDEKEQEEVAQYLGTMTQALSNGYIVNTPVASTTAGSRLIYRLPVSEGDTVTVIKNAAWTKSQFSSEMCFTETDNKVVQYNHGVGGYYDYTGDKYSRLSPCNGYVYVGVRHNTLAPSTWGVVDNDFANAFTVKVSKQKNFNPVYINGINPGTVIPGKFSAVQPTWRGLLSIHRGWATAPENTIESIILAMKNGYRCCEIDVRETSDGVLVLSHDATVTGKVNGLSTTYTISEETYETLSQLVYNNDKYPNCHVAKLEDALNFAKRAGMVFLLDHKVFTIDFAVKVLQMVCRYGMQDDIIFFCWGHTDMMDAIIEKYPRANFCVNNDSYSVFDASKFDSYLNRGGKFIVSFAVNYLQTITRDQWNELADKGYIMGVGEVTEGNLSTALSYNPYYLEPTDAEKSVRPWNELIADNFNNTFDFTA